MADSHRGPAAIIRVVAVDNDAMALRAVVTSIGRPDDITVVATYTDATAAVAAVPQDRPDVVLMDVHMPGLNGVDATKQVLAANPTCAVLALTTLTDSHTAAQLKAAGARGLLYKDIDSNAMRYAIRAANSGLAVSSNPVAPARPTQQAPGVPQLSDLHKRILTMVCAGLSNTQIAEATNLGETTVKVNLRKLGTQLGATNRASLVHRAYELGLV